MCPDNEVTLIAEEIKQYFMMHPKASDTVEGINSWMISSKIVYSMKLVQEALDLLVKKGAEIGALQTDDTRSQLQADILAVILIAKRGQARQSGIVCNRGVAYVVRSTVSQLRDPCSYLHLCRMKFQ